MTQSIHQGFLQNEHPICTSKGTYHHKRLDKDALGTMTAENETITLESGNNSDEKNNRKDVEEHKTEQVEDASKDMNIMKVGDSEQNEDRSSSVCVADDSNNLGPNKTTTAECTQIIETQAIKHPQAQPQQPQ